MRCLRITCFYIAKCGNAASTQRSFTSINPSKEQQGIFLNIVVGIIGAMLGGWIISPLVGVATINQDNFSLPALLVSFVGAVILLAIVRFIRRPSSR